MPKRAEADPLLYHYTDGKGLLGIVSTGELWATEVDFLNDQGETKTRMKLLTAVAEQLSLKSWNPAQSSALSRLLDGLIPVASAVHESVPVFVACFCERPDLLSQWRGYGRDRGFAIGFSRLLLAKPPTKLTGLLQIEYRKKVHVDTVIQECERVLKDFVATDEDSVNDTATKLFSHIYTRSAAFKRGCFREEKEWRLVRLIDREAEVVEQVRLRADPLGIVPFTGLPVGEKGDSAIREVVIGPTPHPRESERGVRYLLEKYEIPLDKVAIRRSRVPLRA